jgi:hypothetical protein
MTSRTDELAVRSVKRTADLLLGAAIDYHVELVSVEELLGVARAYGAAVAHVSDLELEGARSR